MISILYLIDKTINTSDSVSHYMDIHMTGIHRTVAVYFWDSQETRDDNIACSIAEQGSCLH